MDSYIYAGIFAAVLVILCGVGTGLLFRARRNRPEKIDLMEGHEFEEYCARLLREHGFQEVTVTKESGDFGIDVLARREDVTYGIQCKRYAAPVGVKAVQEVYAGKDYYDRMVGVVMTNQYFTAPAVKFAQKLKVILWDRDDLRELEGK